MLVEVGPGAREGAGELCGTRRRAAELSIYSDEQLEFLTGFLPGHVAYQDERMRRLEAL